ncbi:MAG TPA: VWA domain-containing protein [Candidatus Angelobacter sp.]|nr:VWA domain-containing protein [Candidatus Angelobacter sp.]
MALSPASFAARVIEFCRFARDHGLTSAVKESLDALAALHLAGISDRETVKIVLRAVLCSTKEEWDLFDQIFESFWACDHAPQPWQSASEETRTKKDAAARLPARDASLLGQAAIPAETDEGSAVLGATAVERLKKVDFSEIPRDDLADLEQLSTRLVRQMSLRLSRRLKALAPSGLVDIRRSLRRSVTRGGELLELEFKAKKLQRSRLVILLDISGSMNAYSIFLLKFAWVLQRNFRQANTFVFSTQLEDISVALRSRHLSRALEVLSEKAGGWSGGTRIGESLRDFNMTHARKLLTRDTLFIILSDGWDTGEPEVLAAELSFIKRRVRKLIWLNPLLGMTDYQPVTRGMSAALPWIDIFAPAHNLESLLALEAHLARG